MAMVTLYLSLVMVFHHKSGVSDPIPHQAYYFISFTFLKFGPKRKSYLPPSLFNSLSTG